MTMSNEEIARDYCQAANKSKQIKILSDLNCCTPGEIRQILFDQGVPGIAAPKRIRHKAADAATTLLADVQPEPPSQTSVYDQIEAIIAALPENMTEAARMDAGKLLQQMFADYLDKRLELKGEHS